MKRSRHIFMMSLLALSFGLCACATTHKSDSKIRYLREDIDEMAMGTLYKINKTYPDTRSEIEQAAGFAIFSNIDFKFMDYMSIGSARGKGIVVNYATQKSNFMEISELSRGQGFGVRKFKCLFIFETQSALENFVNSGWEFKGSTATRTSIQSAGSGSGLGVKVAPGVMMYQLGADGAIVGISITGARYYKDNELN
jgi:lipid-binding SYLF domain-containing protein